MDRPSVKQKIQKVPKIIGSAREALFVSGSLRQLEAAGPWIHRRLDRRGAPFRRRDYLRA